MTQTSAADVNPLIIASTLPYGAPPFAQIKPDHIVPAYDWALALAKSKLDAIKENLEPPTFENTCAALAFCDEELSRIAGIVSVFTLSQNTKDIQTVYKSVQPKLTEYATSVWVDDDLFARVKHVYDARDTLGLSDEEQLILIKQYRGFENNGITLPPEKRAIYKGTTKQLVEAQRQYMDNLVNHGQELKLYLKADEAHRLDGIPADIIAAYQEAAQTDEKADKDGYVISISPLPIALYEFANDRSLRKDVMLLSLRQGAEGEFDNHPVFKHILELRQQASRTLGFENFADRVIKTGRRMTENYRDVLDFTKTNAETYFPVAEEFFTNMAAFARTTDGVEELAPWDRLYYARKYCESSIGFNSEEAREYFELGNVLEGIFAHTRKLYGLNVLPAAAGKYETINNDTQIYEVFDDKTGEIKALFYANFYANPNKKGGAWMNDVRASGEYRGQKVIPVITNDMNLTKPAQGNPTLLTALEVRTAWHEFGHACHGMLSLGRFPELSGTNTSQDYVELPSQINECWAFKPEVITTYARHYKDQSPIPQYLIDQLQQLDQFEVRWQGLRQAEFGLIDMLYHTADPSTINDLKAFQDEQLAAYKLSSMKPIENAPAQALTFTHIASGYAAGYYVYKWADALVADVRKPFEEAEARGEGCYPKTLCDAFRDKMIVPGGTRPAAHMLADFKTAAGYTDTSFNPTAMFEAEGIPYPAAARVPA